jgi:hypothetical protein
MRRTSILLQAATPVIRLVAVVVVVFAARSAHASDRTVILDLVVTPEDAPEHVCVVTGKEPGCHRGNDRTCGAAKLASVTSGKDGERLVTTTATAHVALSSLATVVDAAVTCDEEKTCRPYITASTHHGDKGSWIACTTRNTTLGNQRVAVIEVEQPMFEKIVKMRYAGSQLEMDVTSAGADENRFTFHLAGGNYTTGRSARTLGAQETASIVLVPRCDARTIRLPLVEDGWHHRWSEHQMLVELTVGGEPEVTCRPVRANREIRIFAPRPDTGEVASLTLCRTLGDGCDVAQHGWLVGAEWSGVDADAVIPAHWRRVPLTLELGCLVPPLDKVAPRAGDDTWSECPAVQPVHGGRCSGTGYDGGANRCTYACNANEMETLAFPLELTIAYDGVEWRHRVRTAFEASELRVPEEARRLYVQAVSDPAVERIEIGDSRRRTFTLEVDKFRDQVPAFGWISAPWLQCEDAVYVRYSGKYYYKRKLIRLGPRPVVLEVDPSVHGDFDQSVVGTPSSLHAWAKFGSLGAIEVIDELDRHVPAALIGFSIARPFGQVWRPAARWVLELGIEGHLTFRPYRPVLVEGDADVGQLEAVLYAREIGWVGFGIAGLSRPGAGWPDRLFARGGLGVGHSFLNRDAHYVGSAELTGLVEGVVAWRIGEQVWLEVHAGALLDEDVQAFVTTFDSEPRRTSEDGARFQFAGHVKVNL